MTAARIQRAVLAVDVSLLRVEGGTLKVLLCTRTEEPFRGSFALPGLALRLDETLLGAARRALIQRGGLSPASCGEIYLEQLATFDDPKRDPRERSISVAYLGLCRESLGVSGEGNPCWHALPRLRTERLAFDHREIIETCVNRLRGKLRYTNVAAQLLPSTFRIEEIETVYAAVLGRSLNRTNFRNKLLKIGLIEKVAILGEAVGKQGGRPPHLYQFAVDAITSELRDFI